MTWLIDIIYELVMSRMAGLIVIWSGGLDDVPDGWHLCDGTNGTPDLRNKFVYGASPTKLPGSTGGSLNHGHLVSNYAHTHDFTSNLHSHFPSGAALVAFGATWPLYISSNPVTGETDPTVTGGLTNNVALLPPFYALAYIMKI